MNGIRAGSCVSNRDRGHWFKERASLCPRLVGNADEVKFRHTGCVVVVALVDERVGELVVVVVSFPICVINGL